jgi:hypothetical protein
LLRAAKSSQPPDRANLPVVHICRLLPAYIQEKVEASERDSTQDWLLPAGAAPPLIGELELRIDEALATAKASEAAVMTVGAAAIDAAEQARRAAELAERAARSAERVERRSASGPGISQAPGGDPLRSFGERADRVLARLREIERRPEPTPPGPGRDRRVRRLSTR